MHMLTVDTLSAPTCNSFHPMGSAIARNHPMPFSSFALGFLRNTTRRIVHAAGDRHPPVTLFLKLMCNFMNGFHGKFLHISVSKQSLAPLGLVLHHIPTGPENFADSDLHHPSNPGLKSASLFLDPVLLHLRRLILVVVASFANYLRFLHAEPLHDGPLKSLAPGKFTHPGIKFSSNLRRLSWGSYISLPASPSS